MAHRTGISNLLPILERICMEHRAMTLLLKETNTHWRADVYHQCKTPKALSDVRGQFGDVYDNLQSDSSDDQVILLLIDALNKTTL
jgi:hypothetical protein